MRGGGDDDDNGKYSMHLVVFSGNENENEWSEQIKGGK